MEGGSVCGGLVGMCACRKLEGSCGTFVPRSYSTLERTETTPRAGLRDDQHLGVGFGTAIGKKGELTTCCKQGVSSPASRLPGFEPGAHGLEGRCSIQLSYRRTPGALLQRTAVGCQSVILPHLTAPAPLSLASQSPTAILQPKAEPAADVNERVV